MTTRALAYSGVTALLFSGLVLAATGCSPDPSPPASAPETEAAAAEIEPTPRLVLLVSIDTLRPDHLGFYGYERFTSPVLDNLAREGVVFDDVSSTASWTLPSHASMLTGLFPREHGVVSFKTVLPEGVPTVASILAKAGWDTAAVVNVEWLKRENYRVTRDFAKYAWAPSTLDRRSPNTWVTDQVLEWVDERGEAPLFVLAHYYDVHSDYLAEEPYEQLFVSPYDGKMTGNGADLKRQALPDAYIESCRQHFDDDRCSFGDLLVVDDSLEKLELSPADVAHIEQLYDAQIRQLDAELARLFTGLRKAGVFDETMVIVTSDHGEEFMEHGGLEHFYTAFQESIRVPLLIRGPGVPAGIRVAQPVSLVDIAPTILARAGVRIPSAMHGIDLARLWHAGGESPGERVFWVEAPGGASQNETVGNYFPVYRAVRRGRYKLVFEQLSDSHALYDLVEDPGEQHDISSREPELAAELLALLKERAAEAGSSEGEAEIPADDLERLRALGYIP